MEHRPALTRRPKAQACLFRDTGDPAQAHFAVRMGLAGHFTGNGPDEAVISRTTEVVTWHWCFRTWERCRNEHTVLEAELMRGILGGLPHFFPIAAILLCRPYRSDPVVSVLLYRNPVAADPG